MQDLFLRYKFTDRGGKDVYSVYTADDRMQMKHVIGEVRLHPDELKNSRPEHRQETNQHGTG